MDIKDIGSSGLVTIVGQRGCGKSTAAIEIWKASGIKRAVVYDPVSENSLAAFQEQLNPVYIHDTIDEKCLDRMMRYQSETKEPLCWIIDNSSCLSRGPSKEKLHQAISTAKECGILTIYLAQYIFDIPIVIRKATDWWMLQPQSNPHICPIHKLVKDGEVPDAADTYSVPRGAFLAVRKHPEIKLHHYTPTHIFLIDTKSYELMHPDALKYALDVFDGRKFLNRILATSQPTAQPVAQPAAVVRPVEAVATIPESFSVLMNPAFLKT